MSLSSSLKKANPKRRTEPLWKGPEEDGITFSLLSRFLCCRERFRLMVVEGLQPQDSFSHRLEFGQMWHVCEEALSANVQSERFQQPEEFFRSLTDYCKQLCKKYPTEQEKVDHWYQICKMQFPLYVQYWSKHPDVKDRTPLLQEQVFEVPYKLPSGRTVRLRGKWDSVDLIGKPMKIKGAMHSGGQSIYLQENKTKSRIDERQIRRQLSFDLQTLIYIIALQEATKGGYIIG